VFSHTATADLHQPKLQLDILIQRRVRIKLEKFDFGISCEFVKSLLLRIISLFKWVEQTLA